MSHKYKILLIAFILLSRYFQRRWRQSYKLAGLPNVFYVTENVVILTCVVVLGNLRAHGLAFGLGPVATFESTVQGEMVGKTLLLHLLSLELEGTTYP